MQADFPKDRSGQSYDPDSARLQFGVDGIDIPYEHADAAIAG
jgi:hypothetical protein